MRAPAVSPSRRNFPITLIACGTLISAASFYLGRVCAPSADANPVTPAGSASNLAHEKLASSFSATSGPAPTTADRVEDPAHWSDSHWKDLAAQPGTHARNAALSDLLEALAASDPARAMMIAQSETNLLLREQLTHAALRGWAKTSPEPATRWALNVLNRGAREAAMSAVLSGAVSTNPDHAVRLVQSLIAQTPGEAVNYGGHLIDALCDAGNFDVAVKMAASGDEASRSFWLGEAYSKWAALQPQQAAQAAAALDDSPARNLALHGVVGGWSQANPGAAVQFILQLPPGSENASLLSQSLERWTKVDLKAASDWIDDHEAGPAMDAGISSVATKEYLKPDVAVGWAESVSNPKLRSETLVSVLRNWATCDLPAARHYYETSQNLLPEDRKEVAGVIATLSGAPSGE